MEPVELPQWVTFGFYAVMVWGLATVLTAFRELAKTSAQALAMRFGLLLWLGIPMTLALRGLLADFSGTPPMLMRVVLVCAAFVIGFSLSRAGKGAALTLSPSLLVGFQGFRLPLELLLHQLARRGALPVEMTFSGYNFDIVTGATALLLWLAIRTSRPVPRWVFLAWNTMGLALLATVVTIAVMSTPEPFGVFEPENRIVAYAPWIWLPTFLVQLALLGHLLFYRQLFAVSLDSE